MDYLLVNDQNNNRSLIYRKRPVVMSDSESFFVCANDIINTYKKYVSNNRISPVDAIYNVARIPMIYSSAKWILTNSPCIGLSDCDESYEFLLNPTGSNLVLYKRLFLTTNDKDFNGGQFTQINTYMPQLPKHSIAYADKCKSSGNYMADVIAGVLAMGYDIGITNKLSFQQWAYIRWRLAEQSIPSKLRTQVLEREEFYNRPDGNKIMFAMKRDAMKTLQNIGKTK